MLGLSNRTRTEIIRWLIICLLPLSLGSPQNPVHLHTAWVFDGGIPAGLCLVFGQGCDANVAGRTGKGALVGHEALGDLPGVGEGAELAGGVHQGNATAPVQAIPGHTGLRATVAVVRAVWNHQRHYIIGKVSKSIMERGHRHLKY